MIVRKKEKVEITFSKADVIILVVLCDKLLKWSVHDQIQQEKLKILTMEKLERENVQYLPRENDTIFALAAKWLIT